MFFGLWLLEAACSVASVVVRIENSFFVASDERYALICHVVCCRPSWISRLQFVFVGAELFQRAIAMVRKSRLVKLIGFLVGLALIYFLRRYFGYALVFIQGHRYWVPKGHCQSPGITPDDVLSDASDLLSNASLSEESWGTNLDVKEDDIFLLVLVISAAGNLADRQLFRSTFGSTSSHMGMSVRTIYVVGRTTNSSLQSAVQQEADRYNDIVQFHFLDSYRNLTLKTCLALKWAVSRSRAHFIAKVDDDNLFNADRLVEYLLSLPTKAAAALYLGFIWQRPIPIRQAQSKWYVSEIEYPGIVYPSYAAGPGYVLSRSAALSIVDKFSIARWLTMEDAFVGICAYLSCLAPLHSDKFVASEVGSHYYFCTYADSIVIHRPDMELRLRYWHEKMQSKNDKHDPCASWWQRLLN